MADVANLRTRLGRGPVVVAPGVYDAFTALVAEQSGFRTLYVSGAAISYTRLGRPDIGLVSMSEVVEIVGVIRDRIDAEDTGYGNALNVSRTMRLFERGGASAIQLEDQDFPKRCGHLDGKVLIPAAEMAGKIKAAVDARRSPETHCKIGARQESEHRESLDVYSVRSKLRGSRCHLCMRLADHAAP